MILAFDTYYFENKGKTVCIAFDRNENENIKVYSETLENIEAYTSGEFYKRELPCILSLLKQIDCSNVELIIVDGFVYLDDNLKLGLGGYLYRELNSNIPVIGVAKTNFATLEKLKETVFRGKSVKPLYITSIGIDLDKAANLIKNMQADYRIPTLLKKLDTLTKDKN